LYGTLDRLFGTLVRLRRLPQLRKQFRRYDRPNRRPRAFENIGAREVPVFARIVKSAL
jgi:hypothetical protein